MDSVQFMLSWYAEQCDGDWEHQYGIKIETLDNPGWHVQIDLAGTALSNLILEEVDVTRTEVDWFVCRIVNHVFEGYGGIFNLRDILDVFASLGQAGVLTQPESGSPTGV